jgi:hypothetical protein
VLWFYVGGVGIEQRLKKTLSVFLCKDCRSTSQKQKQGKKLSFHAANLALSNVKNKISSDFVTIEVSLSA